MSLDHLDRLALAAGYSAVPDEFEEASAMVPARLRFKTPDAPAPRLAPAVAAGTSLVATIAHDTTVARTALTQAVGTALRSAQGLVGMGRAPA